MVSVLVSTDDQKSSQKYQRVSTVGACFCWGASRGFAQKIANDWKCDKDDRNCNKDDRKIAIDRKIADDRKCDNDDRKIADEKVPKNSIFGPKKCHFRQSVPKNCLPSSRTGTYRKTEGIQSYLRTWGSYDSI